MTQLTSLAAIAGALALAACAATPVSDPAPVAPSELSARPVAADDTLTILVSIDGFRADYLDRGATPVMSGLAAGGARAAMRPSFPSKTFPNHYALVTGKRPDRNGIINNRMEDAARPGVVFTLSDRAITGDPIWWDQAAPFWVTAEKAGVPTATMFWPGSDFEIQGVRPGRYETFDQKLPDFARVDLLLGWLDDPASRPRFMTLYFDTVDTAGHYYGPDSPKTTSATAQVDAAIGRLVDGLAARGLADKVNLVITADHGMSEVHGGDVMQLDARAPADAMNVVWTGAFAGLSPVPGREEEVEAGLLGRTAHGECWRKGDMPERFHYGANPRVPAIICLADPGWRYATASMPAYGGAVGGDHGYDPEAPDMAALFIGHGPAFQSGVTLAPFDNVSVYPLLAKLVGIDGEPGDGSLADVAPALAPR